MKVEGGGARGSKSGGDLLADEATLAHTRHHHPSSAIEEGLERAVETVVDPREQVPDGLRFDFENAAGSAPRQGRIVAVGATREQGTGPGAPMADPPGSGRRSMPALSLVDTEGQVRSRELAAAEGSVLSQPRRGPQAGVPGSSR